MCQLNYSCYSLPQDQDGAEFSQGLLNLSQMTLQTLSLLNQPKTTQALTQLAQTADLVAKQRQLASQITSRKNKKTIGIKLFSNTFKIFSSVLQYS